jgi:hypothetical protein
MKRKILAASAVLLAGLSMTGCAAAVEYDGDTTGCLVDMKERVIDGEGESVYRVYSDCGVFEVKDDLLHGAFNSADTYGSIHEGETYDFEAYGWRNGFLSLFPNIVKATPSTPTE